jgi:hypothetical protein
MREMFQGIFSAFSSYQLFFCGIGAARLIEETTMGQFRLK